LSNPQVLEKTARWLESPMTNDHRTIVLIVEDEALIRMNGCDMLADAGFEVLEAESADAAIELLEQREVHMLFSDVDMPGSMDGLQLATLVHERWPHIGLLITSGHRQLTDQSLPDNGKFISKPWHEREVIYRVREVLAAK
jgi:DNA-binding NtrC family response regulator